MEVLIKKLTDGVFDFVTSSEDIKFGGNNIEYWYDLDQVYFKCKDRTYTFAIGNIGYDDGVETIGFATIDDLTTTLKSAGFTGNFNQGGATPQNGLVKCLLTLGVNYKSGDFEGFQYFINPDSVAINFSSEYTNTINLEFISGQINYINFKNKQYKLLTPSEILLIEKVNSVNLKLTKTDLLTGTPSAFAQSFIIDIEDLT